MQTRIPQAAIQDILSRVDIVEIIQSRVALTKKGHNHLSRCPFHDEKTPSFTVSSTKQFYYCFGCSAHGNALSFLMTYDRMEFIDAITYLAQQAGIDVNYEAITQSNQPHQDLYPLMERIANYYKKTLRNAPQAIQYLKSRGLTGQTAKDYGIGYAPSEWDNLTRHLQNDTKHQQQMITAGMLIRKDSGKTYDRFRHRIMFPIRDVRGRIIAFGGRSIGDDTPKYLNSPETPIFHKSNELYGLYEARQKNQTLHRILIVEGYMDVISLHQHGITYAVATLGTATNVKHTQKLLRYTDEIIFCFDGDRAGQQAAWKALTINLPILRDGIHIRFLFLPKNEDPDSYIRTIGKEAFEERIQQAQSLSTVFFESLEQQFPLNSLDAKARFAIQAIQLLNTMPLGIFHQLMSQQLADRCHLPIEELDKLITAQSNGPITPTSSNSLLLAPAQLASALLLQYPNLVDKISDLTALQTVEAPGKSMLIQLIQHFKKQPDLTTGKLLAQWDNAEEKQWIAKLAAHQLPIPEEGVEAEFLGAIARLEERYARQRRQQLIDKAKTTALSPAEKQQLQSLLTDKLARDTTDT